MAKTFAGIPYDPLTTTTATATGIRSTTTPFVYQNLERIDISTADGTIVSVVANRNYIEVNGVRITTVQLNNVTKKIKEDEDSIPF